MYSKLGSKIYNAKLSQRCLHTSRKLSQTLYEVLNLSVNCSTRDVHESYVKLTKMYQIEIESKTERKKALMQLKEAYDVLIKPEVRAIYNAKLLLPRKTKFEKIIVNDAYKPHINKEKYTSAIVEENIQRTVASNKEKESKTKKGLYICLIALYTYMMSQFLVFKQTMTLKYFGKEPSE